MAHGAQVNAKNGFADTALTLAARNSIQEKYRWAEQALCPGM
jgi:hypothetical protein